MPDNSSRLLTLARWALACVLGSVLLVEIWLSLDWRMGTDSPLLHYVAFLIDKHGFVPYRDVFETSMPGTFLFHLAIVKLFGYSESAFRMVDSFFLLLAMTLAWLTVRRINVLCATVGVLGFALLYLGYRIDLQRDFVGFIPILAALYLATRCYAGRYTGALLIGGCCGLAATIKPQLAIGLPVILVYYTAQMDDSSSGLSFSLLIKNAVVAGIALLAVGLLPLMWLAVNGGLSSFMEMAANYLPLHVDMTGNIQTVTADEKYAYIVKKLSRDLPFWIIPTVAGLLTAQFLADLNRQQKQLLWTLAALAVCYIISTVIASQFWLYHWLPFRIFGVLCAALMLIPLRSFSGSKLVEAGLLALFSLVLMVWTNTLDPLRLRVMPPPAFAKQLHGGTPQPPTGNRVDEIARFLNEAELKEDDRVHPLDWTEGSLHAMLLAEAVVATPYIYNYYFYHYISNPYIQEMRKRHIRELELNRPRFLIEVDDELQPSGIDTTDSFPELEAFVRDNYSVVLAGEQYRIFELRK